MAESDKAIRALHGVLNDMLALFWRDTEGLNCRERALDALALRPDLPVTLTFAAEVRRRAGVTDV